MTVKYAAVMEPSDAGGFGVWFPDFPGCVSQDSDPLAAVQAGRKALTRHIQAMADDGLPIPQPKPAEAVELPHDVSSYVFLVEVDNPHTKTVYTRINLTLPETLVRRIDAVAGGNRSGWLAAAANEALKRYPVIPGYAASLFSARDGKR
jgi:predicted RNase H-like HicB family nuclease